MGESTLMQKSKSQIKLSVLMDKLCDLGWDYTAGRMSRSGPKQQQNTASRYFSSSKGSPNKIFSRRVVFAIKGFWAT